MKQNALEITKSNLPEIFSRYYTDKDNKWLWDVCEENPFVEFKEVPDFTLAPLDSDLTKGEIDMENCKIIYKNLMFISESQASDERLWAGLTHGVFYEYMRKRWEYDVKPPKSPKKSIGEIKTRYFFEGGKRGGFYRNTLAKCWWVGRMLYDKTNANPFEKLYILGSNDLSTKITDIFYSNTYSSNPEILDGIINCFRYFNNEGVKINSKEQIRPTLQFLNAVGGGIILDCLSSEEITDIMIENIEKIIQGDNANIENIDDDNYINDEEEEDAVYSENKDMDDEIYVALGCKVTAVVIQTGEKKVYKADYFNGNIPTVIKNMLGMRIGDVFEINKIKYRIEEILF
ncbi:MAG: hypothetical protein EOM50_13825 [Erysipelotrichia bacterium]|nr:hypothetical protein [Erysipelotrichia bacterium]